MEGGLTNPMQNHKVVKKKTEAETALARPKTRKEELQEMLLARRQALVGELKRELERHRGRPAQRGLGLDLAEEAGTSLEDEIGLTTASRWTELVKQIDRALERLKEGIYGICEDCGGEISIGRLKALPFAIRCTRCQERWEASAARAKERSFFFLDEEPSEEVEPALDGDQRAA